MCFHTSQTKKVLELENRFDVSLHDNNAREAFDIPSYHLNGFSHPHMLLIPQEEPSVLAIGTWGIVPSNKKPEDLDSYYKEAIRFGGGLNAQSEKLFDHFIYKHSAISKRCIIPVTGFFEPHEYKNKKYPFHIKRKDNDAIGLAGLYTSVGGILTFTILTKAASPLFEKIHNIRKRQPILLSPDFEKEWLKDDLSKDAIKELISLKYFEDQLDAFTVSKDLFSPKINSNTKDILEKRNFEELPLSIV